MVSRSSPRIFVTLITVTLFNACAAREEPRSEPQPAAPDIAAAEEGGAGGVLVVPEARVVGYPGGDGAAMPSPEEPRRIPYSGSVGADAPPARPIAPGQKPLSADVQSALGVLYQRPSPDGPAAVPLERPRAVRVEGRGSIIQVLPAPAAFADSVPARIRTAMPREGPFSNDVVRLRGGEFRAVAFDRTRNDTKLSRDSMAVEIAFTDRDGAEWEIVQLALAPLSSNPVAEPWLGGVVIDTLYHGGSGNGTPAVPLVSCKLCSWGWADIWENGKKVASSAPLHIMLTSDARDDARDFRYSCYDCRDQPIRQVHVMVPPSVGLPTPGGFLHVMWENAEWSEGTPEEIAAAAPRLGIDLPTLRLEAVEYLKWSASEIRVAAGQPFRLVLDNHDPSSFHAFMISTPQGEVHVPMPQGSTWVTSLVFDQPGEYEFWCPVSNHRGRGMYGRVVVGGGVPGGSEGPPR